VLADVCGVLGLSNPSMVARGLDADEKDGVSIVDPIGREQITTVISEPGLYKLIATSRKAEAERPLLTRPV
jgi:prophage antirepressor-like protein